MKTIIRLTESELHNIVRHTINEILRSTIQLQFINGAFYPVDSISRKILEDELNTDRITERDFNIVSPRLVKRGYKMAITNYTSQKSEFNPPTRKPIGGEPHPTKDPCPKCGFHGLCDKDECGKKNFRLFKK
jgi:hypothetical protein